MKYKILLTGKDGAMIDDLFSQLSDRFDLVTTSIRFVDIINHINFFRPDIFVYCLQNESQDDLAMITNLKYRLAHADTPMVIIGLKEDCDAFERIDDTPVNLTLRKPFSMATVQDKLIALVKNSRFMQAVDEISEENASKARAAAAAAAAAEQSATPGMAAAAGQSAVPRTTPTAEQPAMPGTASAAGQSVAPRTGFAAESSAVSKTVAGTVQQRKHILVVDDNAMMLKMIKEHLHDQYDVATAASGRVALKFLERKKTDLILLDYEMPDESGPAVLEQLRASESTRNIPVIFLTGVTDTNKIMEALALKPQNYLLKPVDREKLLDTISKTIG